MDRRNIMELFDEQKEYLDKRVAEGIEKNRKGKVKIKVTDGFGKALPNVEIKVRQTNHEFRFGANIFMLDQLESEQKNERYKQYFVDVFNMATLPFYWKDTEPKQYKTRYSKDSEKVYRRPPIDLCMEFCAHNGVEPREHALAYDLQFPDWLKGKSDLQVKRELERRYAEISSRYANDINTIEVTNETFWDNGVTDFYKAPDFVEWCFKTAEKYFPKNQLGINDATWVWETPCDTTSNYYKLIDKTLKSGARIDAVGLQYHMFNRLEEEYQKTRLILNPKNLYDHLDLYATFDKPLQITEVTVPSYSWKPEDEQIQAEIIERLYSIWFSHPNVEQIIYWNLVDGYAYVSQNDEKTIRESQGNMSLGENYYHGGLLRFDLTPKPAYYTIKELIQKKWRTEENLRSNQNGEVEFSGFYGDYSLDIVNKDGIMSKNIKFSKKGKNNFEIDI